MKKHGSDQGGANRGRQGNSSVMGQKGVSICAPKPTIGVPKVEDDCVVYQFGGTVKVRDYRKDLLEHAQSCAAAASLLKTKEHESKKTDSAVTAASTKLSTLEAAAVHTPLEEAIATARIELQEAEAAFKDEVTELKSALRAAMDNFCSSVNGPASVEVYRETQGVGVYLEIADNKLEGTKKPSHKLIVSEIDLDQAYVEAGLELGLTTNRPRVIPVNNRARQARSQDFSKGYIRVIPSQNERKLLVWAICAQHNDFSVEQSYVITEGEMSPMSYMVIQGTDKLRFRVRNTNTGEWAGTLEAAGEGTLGAKLQKAAFSGGKKPGKEGGVEAVQVEEPVTGKDDAAEESSQTTGTGS